MSQESWRVDKPKAREERSEGGEVSLFLLGYPAEVSAEEKEEGRGGGGGGGGGGGRGGLGESDSKH